MEKMELAQKIIDWNVKEYREEAEDIYIYDDINIEIYLENDKLILISPEEDDNVEKVIYSYQNGIIIKEDDVLIKKYTEPDSAYKTVM